MLTSPLVECFAGKFRAVVCPDGFGVSLLQLITRPPLVVEMAIHRPSLDRPASARNSLAEIAIGCRLRAGVRWAVSP